jgi:hypothetical protein
MARTNVEDDWFVDKSRRRATLIRIVANLPKDPERQADGLALDAWSTAQRYWKDGEQLIPEDVWTRSGFEPLIEAGLAERRENGIYVRGSSSHHDWLYRKNEAAKRGGAARKNAPRDERGRFQPSAGDGPAIHHPVAGPAGKKVHPSTTPPAPAPAPAPALKDSPSESCPTAAVGPRELAQVWNELKAPCHPEVRLSSLKASSPRWRHAAARLKEQPDLDYWREVIRRLAGWPWGRGENDRGWVAGFDYLVKPDTHVRAMEGAFADRSAPKAKTPLAGYQTYGEEKAP